MGQYVPRIIEFFDANYMQKYDLSSLSAISGGGSFMPPTVYDKIIKQFRDQNIPIAVMIFYSSTELGHLGTGT